METGKSLNPSFRELTRDEMSAVAGGVDISGQMPGPGGSVVKYHIVENTTATSFDFNLAAEWLPAAGA